MSEVRVILDERIVNGTVHTAKYPYYATPLSAGADVHAFCPGTRIIVKPGQIVPVPTGLRMALPKGTGLFVLPRSGLSMKGIKVANAPGLVDADYRDEIKVLIENRSEEDFVITNGDRIAQLVLKQVEVMDFVRVSTLELTERTGGFGSTGVAGV